MSSRIDAIMESEETKQFLVENEEIIQEADALTRDFTKVLKSFVMQHPDEFIAENLEETEKNIRVFTEVSVAQFMHEITTIMGDGLQEQEMAVEESVNEYI